LNQFKIRLSAACQEIFIKSFYLEQEFIKKLSHGDEVYTKSGILGKIAGITEQFVTLEVSDGVKMKVLKTHVGGSMKALFTEAKTEKK
jgi:preprotein translocase subunit YajC